MSRPTAKETVRWEVRVRASGDVESWHKTEAKALLVCRLHNAGYSWPCDAYRVTEQRVDVLPEVSPCR